jgi:hypothetical protein
MSVHNSIRVAAIAPVALSAMLLAGCGAASSGAVTATGNPITGGNPTAGGTPTAGGSQPGAGTTSSSGAKCTDLTAAAASAAVGKAVTVTLDSSGTQLAGLTVCNVVDADEVYSIQLDVDTSDAQALYSADQGADGGVGLAGVGDKAFTSSLGVEVLSGSVDIQVIGPAGPVLGKDYTIPTAVAKAMVAALS